ncbi:hypothetical protein C4J81_10620 [Deltaproteobacteria bacterium Smac51]|nr:hypothetical protein C4J81_10620 [Deltaproteobacteria bacterium Smac51]
MIPDKELNIWNFTKNSIYSLYEERAANYRPEMDCHAQAADIYQPHFDQRDRILDAGGGSGYFYWSLKTRGLLGDYYLLDQTEDFVDMGRRHLKLSEDRFILKSIQETPGRYEVTFCLNALFCLPDYRQGLESLLLATEKIIVLRTALAERTLIRYEKDDYLDPAGSDLKSYFNIWSMDEIGGFMSSYGFEVSTVVDRRTNDEPEVSAGKIFPWRWLIGLKK